MKPMTLLSAFFLSLGLCFAAPDAKDGKKGPCKKGACKKTATGEAAPFQVAFDDDKPERKGPRGERGDRRRGGPPGRGGDRGEFFKKLDTDESGGVSLEEMLAGMPMREGGDEARRKAFITKMHAARDADGNGEVTAEEMKQGMKGRRGGPGGKGGRPGAGRGGEGGPGPGADRPQRPPLGD